MIHLPISNSSSSVYKSLETVASAPVTINITVKLLFIIFVVNLQGLRTCRLFRCFWIFFFPLHDSFYIFVDYHLILSSMRIHICLYLKLSATFMFLVHQDVFWFVNGPFSCMVKFLLHEQFPIDPLPLFIVSRLILPLR